MCRGETERERDGGTATNHGERDDPRLTTHTVVTATADAAAEGAVAAVGAKLRLMTAWSKMYP